MLELKMRSSNLDQIIELVESEYGSGAAMAVSELLSEYEVKKLHPVFERMFIRSCKQHFDLMKQRDDAISHPWDNFRSKK